MLHEPHSRPYPLTDAEFNSFVKKIEGSAGYKRPLAFGIGTVQRDKIGLAEKFTFETLNFKENFKAAAVIRNVLGFPSRTHRYEPSLRQLERMLAGFRRFEGQPNHGNIEALKKAKALAQKNEAGTETKVFPVIIFIDEGYIFKDAAHTSLLDSLRAAGKIKR